VNSALQTLTPYLAPGVVGPELSGEPLDRCRLLARLVCIHGAPEFVDGARVTAKDKRA
jgi:hypothetical protein